MSQLPLYHLSASPGDANPRYPRLHPSSAAPSSETKGELFCQQFSSSSFHLYTVRIVCVPSPPFVPGLGDHGVCRLVPPRPRCKLVVRPHSIRVISPIDQRTTRVSLSRPRDAQNASSPSVTASIPVGPAAFECGRIISLRSLSPGLEPCADHVFASSRHRFLLPLLLLSPKPQLSLRLRSGPSPTLSTTLSIRNRLHPRPPTLVASLLRLLTS